MAGKTVSSGSSIPRPDGHDLGIMIMSRTFYLDSSTPEQLFCLVVAEGQIEAG